MNSDRYQTIGEINRATIIDDLFNLARVKYVLYSTVLRATEYLAKENEYLPWRAFFNGMSYLHKQFEGKEAYKAFVVRIYQNKGREIKQYRSDSFFVSFAQQRVIFQFGKRKESSRIYSRSFWRQNLCLSRATIDREIYLRINHCEWYSDKYKL